MSADGPQVNIQLENYPPDAPEVSIQTIAFGAPGPLRMLLEVDQDEDTGDVEVKLTLDVGAKHDEVTQFLAEAIELLENIRDSAQPEIDAQVAELTEGD